MQALSQKKGLEKQVLSPEKESAIETLSREDVEIQVKELGKQARSREEALEISTAKMQYDLSYVRKEEYVLFA